MIKYKLQPRQQWLKISAIIILVIAFVVPIIGLLLNDKKYLYACIGSGLFLFLCGAVTWGIDKVSENIHDMHQSILDIHHEQK